MDILVEVQFFLQSGLVHATQEGFTLLCFLAWQLCSVYNKHTVLAPKTRKAFMQVTQYMEFTHNELFFFFNCTQYIHLWCSRGVSSSLWVLYAQLLLLLLSFLSGSRWVLSYKILFLIPSLAILSWILCLAKLYLQWNLRENMNKLIVSIWPKVHTDFQNDYSQIYLRC